MELQGWLCIHRANHMPLDITWAGWLQFSFKIKSITAISIKHSQTIFLWEDDCTALFRSAWPWTREEESCAGCLSSFSLGGQHTNVQYTHTHTPRVRSDWGTHFSSSTIITTTSASEQKQKLWFCYNCSFQQLIFRSRRHHGATCLFWRSKTYSVLINKK